MKKTRFSLVFLLFLASAWLLAGWVVVGLKPAKMGVLGAPGMALEVRRMNVSLSQGMAGLAPAAEGVAWLAGNPQGLLWICLEQAEDSLLSQVADTLVHLCLRHQVKPGRLMLEHARWAAMRYPTLRGLLTTHAMQAPPPSELTGRGIDSVLTRTSRLLSSGCFAALAVSPEWQARVRGLCPPDGLTRLVVVDTLCRPWNFCLSPSRLLMLRDSTVHSVVLRGR